MVESKSSGGKINGYVGAIEGFFQRTLMPNKKNCANNRTAYFSGHYEHFGSILALIVLVFVTLKEDICFLCRTTRKNKWRTVV